MKLRAAVCLAATQGGKAVRVAVLRAVACLLLFQPVSLFSQQPTPSERTTAAAPLTNQDVISLVKAGLSPEVVAAKIQASPCHFETSPAILKDLHAEGVPDSVILAMVEARCSSPSPPLEQPSQLKRSGQNMPGCKVRFAVYQSNPHISGGVAPGMSKEQGKWYEKNKKSYPALCLDGENPDYFVVWSSRFSSEGAPEPVLNFGGMTGYAGDVGVGASGYEVSSPLASEYVYLSIFRAADVQRARQDKSYQPRPVYYTQHDSWWTYRKSHHKAMEDALRFLARAADK